MSPWRRGRLWLDRMRAHANDRDWQQKHAWETWREAHELGQLTPLAADVLLRLMKRNPQTFPWIDHQGRLMVHLPDERWGAQIAPAVDLTASQFHSFALIARNWHDGLTPLVVSPDDCDRVVWN